jgi:DNA-binding MarR family transcriptional regulator
MPRTRAPVLPSVEKVDTSYLEALLGYNARRGALAVIEVFIERMAPYAMRPVDFSVASLILHNPGITSRQLCAALGILPPNLVGIVNTLEKRGLIARMPHPTDGRAMGLHPTAEGIALMAKAEVTASTLEEEVGGRLTKAERKTILRLLQKIYR